MKKAIGLLSVVLALTIFTCSVTPVLSETIRDTFSRQPQLASLSRSVNDQAAADEEGTSGKESTQKEMKTPRLIQFNYSHNCKVA